MKARQRGLGAALARQEARRLRALAALLTADSVAPVSPAIFDNGDRRFRLGDRRFRLTDAGRREAAAALGLMEAAK